MCQCPTGPNGCKVLSIVAPKNRKTGWAEGTRFLGLANVEFGKCSCLNRDFGKWRETQGSELLKEKDGFQKLHGFMTKRFSASKNHRTNFSPLGCSTFINSWYKTTNWTSYTNTILDAPLQKLPLQLPPKNGGQLQKTELQGTSYHTTKGTEQRQTNKKHLRSSLTIFSCLSCKSGFTLVIV